MWKSITDVLYPLMDKHIPKITVGGKPKKGDFPLSLELRDLIKAKRIAHRKWIRHMGMAEQETCHCEYVKYRNQLKYALRKARRKREAEVAAQAKEKPSMFWSHTRRMLKTKSGMAPLRSDPQDPTSLCFEPKEKANILHYYYISS